MILKKIVLVLLLLLSFSFADKLDDKLYSFIGETNYKIHKNLLDHLFKKRDNFIYEDKINYIGVLKVLQENGLLHLQFDKPKKLTVKFHINADHLKTLKILNDTLKSLGYYYYFTKETVKKANGDLTWTIEFKTRYAIDPLIFGKKLLSNDTRMIDIVKHNENNWEYYLDSSHAVIAEAVLIEKNEKKIFSKPLNDYLIKVKDAQRLRVISRTLNHWFPYIVFYDEHLNILKTIKKDAIHRYIKTPVPQGTVYIKISDLYMLLNIKRGLSIIVN